MIDKKADGAREKPSDRLEKRPWDPAVEMVVRHWVFIAPLLLFAVGIFILYLGNIDCNEKRLTCLTNTDKSYVAACIGFIAASIGLSSWLSSFYQELDRQRFDLFNGLHKEFRTTEQFNTTFKEIVKIEKIVGKNKYALVGEDPFDSVGDAEAVNFAAFFEIVAVSVQSNLMSARIANYFFGNYLLMALKSSQFRSKIGYDDEESKLYWSLMRHFEAQMMVERDEMTRDRYASSLRI
jgi:hypothetical protein